MNELERWMTKHRILGDIDKYVIDYENSTFYGWTNQEYIDFTNIPPVKVLDLCNGGMINRENSLYKISDSEKELVQNIVIPETVEVIRKLCFIQFVNIEEIVIPNSVHTIERLAFGGCIKLRNVEMSDSLTGISPSAFSNTPFLDSILSKDNKGMMIQGNTLIRAIGSVAETTDKLINYFRWFLKIPDDIVFMNDECCKNTKIRELDTGDGLKAISHRGFRDCSNLKDIKIGKSVKYIHSYAFAGCDSIEKLSIPSNVVSIGPYAFDKCTCLCRLYLHEGIQEIHKFAFKDCGLMNREVRIPESCDMIHLSSFANIYGLTLYISKNTVIVSDYTLEKLKIIRY